VLRAQLAMIPSADMYAEPQQDPPDRDNPSRPPLVRGGVDIEARWSLPPGRHAAPVVRGGT